jgi:Flp pilus assembly protein TadB
MPRDQARSEAPVRITTAAASREADISARQRRYVLSMGFRTLCFVTAVIVGHGVIMWLLIVAALLLPYVAVVMANAGSSKADDFALQDVGRPELPSASRREL